MIQYIIAAGIGAFLGSRSKKSKKSYAHGGEVKAWLKDGTKVQWYDPEEEYRDLDRVWVIKDYDGQLAEILKEEDYEDFLDDLIINIESEDGFSNAEVPYWEIKKSYAKGGEVKFRKQEVKNAQEVLNNFLPNLVRVAVEKDADGNGYMIVGYYDDPKYGSSSHSERLDRYYSMDIFLNFFLQRKEYMLASKEEQLAFKGHPAFYGDSYAKGGKTHIMPDGSKMLDSDHYAKGGTIEERVYAIDKRNFRSKNLLNTLDDEKFMQIAENKGLVWSSMDKFLDSNEYNEEGDNLNFREIPVKMMVAKEYVNPDFL